MEQKSWIKIALGLVVLGVLLNIFYYSGSFLIIQFISSSGYVLIYFFVLLGQVSFILAWLIFSTILMDPGKMRRVVWWILEIGLTLTLIGGLGIMASYNATNIDRAWGYVIIAAFFGGPLLSYIGLGLMLYVLGIARLDQKLGKE